MELALGKHTGKVFVTKKIDSSFNQASSRSVPPGKYITFTVPSIIVKALLGDHTVKSALNFHQIWDFWIFLKIIWSFVDLPFFSLLPDPLPPLLLLLVFYLLLLGYLAFNPLVQRVPVPLDALQKPQESFPYALVHLLTDTLYGGAWLLGKEEDNYKQLKSETERYLLHIIDCIFLLHCMICVLIACHYNLFYQ